MNSVTSIPRVLVEVGGRALNDAESRALSEALVQQRLSAPSLCELTFVDLDENEGAANAFLPGLSLRVFIGGQEHPIFAGDITAIEYEYQPSRGRVIRLRGYDALHRLRKRQPVRAHVQASLLDLVRELTGDLGITVEGSSPGPAWRRIIQYRQSDLDFLVHLADRCGLFLTLRGDTLHMIAHEGIGAPVPLRLGDNIFELRVEVNADSACREVTAMGWDPSHVTWHTGGSTEPTVGRQVAARAHPEDLGGDGKRIIANETSVDPAFATAVAQAELDSRTAREVTLWAVAAGNTELRPGSVASISGVAEAIAGEYVISSATHSIDRERGYVTEINTEPPPRRPRDQNFFTAPGMVTRVDDPEGLGRVQASLPTCGDLETDWMCILSAGAGAGKGLMALPDASDQVLVLCSAENPAVGFVLGGLYGSGGWPDTGIESGAVARYTLLTPGGQRVRLDDSRKAIRLENSAGSFVELLPDKVTVHANTDLLIEAPGRSIMIEANRVDFRRT